MVSLGMGLGLAPNMSIGLGPIFVDGPQDRTVHMSATYWHRPGIMATRITISKI